MNIFDIEELKEHIEKLEDFKIKNSIKELASDYDFDLRSMIATLDDAICTLVCIARECNKYNHKANLNMTKN
jgi:hypothetical protein